LVLAVTNAFAVHSASGSSRYRPELELLFLCARQCPSPEAIEAAREILARPIEWEVLLDAARQHRVVPLVYRNLSTMDAGLVPDEVVRTLQLHFRRNSWSNLKLTAELMRVHDVLAADEIPVIPYKGPTLATFLYGDVSMRQFGDLDIILHEKDVERARELLGALGYRLALDITGKDVSLFHDRLGITLEVHWCITGDRHPVQIPAQRLWKNLDWTPFAGKTVLAHTPEDLLWVLGVHGGQHRWERLIWLCDVAELARRPTLDWDRAMHNARELRAGRTVALALVLARDLLGVTLPPGVQRSIEADPVLIPLAGHVKSCLAAPRPEKENLGELERYYIMLGDRIGDRIRIAVRQAVPYLAPSTREEEMLRLPWYLSWVLYVVRPVRLAWNYGLTPLKRLLKGLFQS
jgi:hypothetical protein